MKIGAVWVFILFPGPYWTAEGEILEGSGTSGSSLTLDYKYQSHLMGYKHYWCRGNHWFYCTIVVQSTGSEEEVKEGRFSIKDNHKALTVSVTMRDLTLEDSGIYWCGTEKTGIDEMYKVHVTISASDPTVVKPTISANKKWHLLPTSSASPVAPKVLPLTVPFEKITNPFLSSSTASGTEATTSSFASYMALQWKAKATLCGIIPLAITSVCIISRNRRKPMKRLDVERDEDISLASLSIEGMLPGNSGDSSSHGSDRLSFIDD
ncbi:CMRF35-like molecule 3 [Ambystoma mexicanum]|uniref:CMRF35-like molecule 3 n=1 Tax=Ambystoma mexicanum TaxID=8296 RepID=UPI0037E7FFEF